MRALKFVAIGLLAAILLTIGVFTFLLGPKDKANSDKVDVKIEQGAKRSEIATLLSDQGLVRSRFAFFVYSRLFTPIIIPGIYEFSPSDSATVMLEAMANGKFKTTRVTIKEGWWAQDIEDELVNDKGLVQFVGFAEKAKADEGYLFPDTYDIKADATIDEVIALLRGNFDRRTKGLAITPDVVILASIVEREAKGDSDRAAIAGVYFNRLKQGMRLEADATVQYAKGSSKAIVTVDDYRGVISPYNTYLNDGLPPGPISNPGLASIKAVLNPEQHDYLYYFHAQGQTFFSKTYEEHRAKIQKYF